MFSLTAVWDDTNIMIKLSPSTNQKVRTDIPESRKRIPLSWTEHNHCFTNVFHKCVDLVRRRKLGSSTTNWFW